MRYVIQQLNTAYSNYNDTIKKVESFLISKVEFEFKILYQQGDGHVILDIGSDSGDLAPLDICLDIIDNKGKLTHKEFKKFSI